VFHLAIAFVATNCAAVFPTPYSIDQLKADSPSRSGASLVHYLSQREPDLRVCDVVDGTFQSATADETLVEPFFESLENPQTNLVRWGACAKKMMVGLSPKMKELAFNIVAKQLQRAKRQENIDALDAIAKLLYERVPQPSEALEHLVSLMEGPRGLVKTNRISTLDVALRNIHMTLSLDTGRLGGSAITQQLIETLFDESVLLRMSTRLPNVGLRLVAKKRLISLHTTNSRFSEVRNNAEQIQSLLFDNGKNSLPLGAVSQLNTAIESATLLARQEFDMQIVQFTSIQKRESKERISSINSMLQFDVGLSLPVGLCHSPEDLFEEPCVDLARVELAHPLVKVTAAGFYFVDSIPIEFAAQLAFNSSRFVIPVSVDQKPVGTLSFQIEFAAPAPLFIEAISGKRTDPLSVTVHAQPDVFIFETRLESVHKMSIVPRQRLLNFMVAFKGLKGQAGRNGINGNDGRDGEGAATVCATCRRTQAAMEDEGIPEVKEPTVKPEARAQTFRFS
jgi:hypothetical protein